MFEKNLPRVLRMAGVAFAMLGLALPASAQVAAVRGTATDAPPSILFGQLFRDVQLASVFPDQKTFCDLIPKQSPAEINAAYAAERGKPGFSLAAFVGAHFRVQSGVPVVSPAPAGESANAYIAGLWNTLQERTADVNGNAPYTSLLQLPHPFVVPGGRFSEMYYWDSYFTMLGLEADDRHDVVENMIADFAFEIDRYGHIPNGNRTYYLSRSQPPFFSKMVDLLARRDGERAYVRYLPELRSEYEYWMAGSDRVGIGRAFRNVVRMPDGAVLNRYWDERDVPRDESYLEDVMTASTTTRAPSQVYRNLRATAESGWDFSSRWLADGKTLATVETLDILPVDLNSLLEHLEETLAHAYRVEGDRALAARFERRADVRAAEIRRVFWDARLGIFGDYQWQRGRLTGRPSAATMYPLFFGIASREQAASVTRAVGAHFLEPNGMATTLVSSMQQWDQPNGWAPLQYVTVEGLRRYGADALARTIAGRWVNVNLVVFNTSRKFVEKYDLLTATGGMGGEYTTQIGFGWTNGVFRAFTSPSP